MTVEAQDLLSILSMLPNGLTDRDLVQAKLPIANILGCKATLLRTSLAFIDKDHRLKVLAPIREHTLTMHAPTNTVKLALRQHIHAILQLWSNFHVLNTADIVSQVSQNLANLNSVLLDALNTECSDAIQNFESIMLLNSFYRNTQDTGSPLFQNLSEKILAWKDQPIFGKYLIERFTSVGYLPMTDAEEQMVLGKAYFHAKDPLQQGTTGFKEYV
jgi:hypothetical protein